MSNINWVGIARVEHVRSTILYVLEPPIYSRNLYHHFVSITLPTYTYISFGDMLTIKGNLLKIICKEFSYFICFFLNLGEIIKEYNTWIKKLTLPFHSVRISLEKISNEMKRVIFSSPH